MHFMAVLFLLDRTSAVAVPRGLLPPPTPPVILADCLQHQEDRLLSSRPCEDAGPGRGGLGAQGPRAGWGRPRGHTFQEARLSWALSWLPWCRQGGCAKLQGQHLCHPWQDLWNSIRPQREHTHTHTWPGEDEWGDKSWPSASPRHIGREGPLVLLEQDWGSDLENLSHSTGERQGMPRAPSCEWEAQKATRDVGAGVQSPLASASSLSRKSPLSILTQRSGAGRGWAWGAVTGEGLSQMLFMPPTLTSSKEQL